MKSTGQKLKPVKCKWCKESYIRMNTLQKACSPSCALALTRRDTLRKEQKKEREIKQRHRKWKEDNKTIPELKKEAQAAVNAYVRFRDAGKDCICCPGTPLPIEAHGGAFDAGHWRSRGAASHLCFNLWNIHGQLKYCNRHMSGNATAYREGLIQRIGLEKVEWLECQNAPRKFSREYLTRIRDIFRKKLRLAKRRQ